MPFKRLAGQALNILPDRMNLFLRYMSGVGNEGLELDESTLRSLRAATEKPDMLVDYIDPKEAARDMMMMSPEMEADIAAELEKTKTDEFIRQNRELGLPDVTPLHQAMEERLEKSRAIRSGDFDSVFPEGIRKDPIRLETPKHGPHLPASGAVNPYATTQDKAATQTLGRFMAQVNPDGSIRIQDTYDMVNEAEDPDLVSGSFRPDKALSRIRGIWDAEERARHINQINIEQGNEPRMMRPPADNRSYGQKIKDLGADPTASPLTQVARAAMYLAPYKPKPFDIDITIPPTTR